MQFEPPYNHFLLLVAVYLLFCPSNLRAEIEKIKLGSCENQLSYEFKKPQNKELPVVIYFGGGPSVSTIDTSSFPIPSEFGFLRFDYPGVGLNQGLVKCGIWTSERIARNLVRVLRSKKLNNYLIYGVSYGSVPATIAAALLEHDPYIRRARLLLLEGTIGRVYKPGEVISSFKEQWQRVIQGFSPGQRLILKKKIAKSCSPESWGAWAETVLSIGAGPGHGHLAEELLLASTQKGAKLGFCAKSQALKINDAAREAYQNLICREINPTAPDHAHSYRLVDLALRPRPGNVCSNIKLSRPYDSARWQIEETPIVYFIGLRDPVTPVSQAHYHSHNQLSTARIHLEVPQGAHNPLSVTLSDCAQELFKSFLVSTNAVQATRLNSCSRETIFRVQRPFG